MAKHKGQNQDEELDNYLTNDFNIGVYEELTSDSEEPFEPLEFFNLLYAQYEFVKNNKAKPLTVVKHLKRLNLNDDQKSCLFYYLCELIENENPGREEFDKQMEICCGFIQKEVDRLIEKLRAEKRDQEKTSVQTEAKDLDSYITDKFNLEIYEFVNKEQSLFMCEPLAFLQLLHSTYEWILQNTGKPLAIAERLKNPYPCRWYFLEKIEGLLKRKVDGDDLTDIEKLLHSLEIENDKEHKKLKEALEIVHDYRLTQTKQRSLEKSKFDFNKVKQHIETLYDDKAKIKYLVELKTEFQQQDALLRMGNMFDKQCDLEIKKLEKLLALERSSRSQKGSLIQSEAVTRNPDFTTARQVLAVHYLLRYCQVTQASNADVARFIEFLTGKNYKNIYKRVCNPLGSRDKELTEDLRFVRVFFEKLGMAEIVKMINNEMDSGSF